MNTINDNLPTEELIVKIALVDDHQLFRDSLKRVLDLYTNISVVFEACNGIELQKKLIHHKVDIILMDVHMPRQNGMITCKKVLKINPSIKVLALSAFKDEEIVLRMIESGASGFFTKNTNVDDLHNGIMEIHKGGYYFDHSLGKILSAGIKQHKKGESTSDQYITELSYMEIEVLKLVCKQFTNKQISKELSLSVRTIETHRRNLLDKTQSKNMIGVVVYAFQKGIVDFSLFHTDNWGFFVGRGGVA